VGETFANLLAPFARINDVDLSKVTRIQLETSARNAQFITRNIDVMSLYTNDQVPLLEKRLKLKFNVLKLSDFGLPLLGQGFMVNRDFAQTNPEVIRMLLRATAKGYADTFNDRKAAIAIMNKYMKVKIDPDVMEAQLAATLEATPRIEGRPLGWQDESLWRANLDLLVQSGRVKEIKPLDLYFTNQYLH
jgi:NitT/TauT family transport system substrate-binding protein